MFPVFQRWPAICCPYFFISKIMRPGGISKSFMWSHKAIFIFFYIVLLMKVCLKTFLLFSHIKPIINSCCSLFRFMGLAWSILDHKENSTNAGPLRSGGFLTDMYCALVILPNNKFEQLEMGSGHLAFVAGNRPFKNTENWKSERGYRFNNWHRGWNNVISLCLRCLHNNVSTE